MLNMKTDEGKYFSKYLEALERQPVLLENSNSFTIYVAVFEMRMAMWRYCVNVNRNKEYSFADYFQDIVAKHIQSLLKKNCTVFLEEKDSNFRPDIIIKKKDEILAIIEIKTTVGWNRDLVLEDGYLERINEIAEHYSISPEKVFFIFESSGNVNGEFKAEVCKSKDNKYSGKIYPLFSENAHPFFMPDKIWSKDWSNVPNYTYQKIKDHYYDKENKVELHDLRKILRDKKII